MESYLELKEQGNSALKEQNFDLAKECFEKALALDLNNPDAYNILGNLYAEQEDFESAEQYYRQAMQIPTGMHPITWGGSIVKSSNMNSLNHYSLKPWNFSQTSLAFITI